MSIRKCKRKLALCIASLFWVACGNDSSSNANIVANDPSDSENPSSSGSLDATSSGMPTSDADGTLPSSSDAISPTSSSAYVNPDYPYTLGLKPSVHCRDSIFYIPSPCPSYRAKIKSTIASIQVDAPLYGIVQPVCAITAHNDSIYSCDNGMKYTKGSEFILQKDTIVQCAPTSYGDKTCSPAKEYYTKYAEDAEASTKYPFKLASDTTVNCKESYTAKIVTNETYPGLKTEKWGVEGKYKCEDGNTYEYEDLLRNEFGGIYHSSEEAEN